MFIKRYKYVMAKIAIRLWKRFQKKFNIPNEKTLLQKEFDNFLKGKREQL